MKAKFAALALFLVGLGAVLQPLHAAPTAARYEYVLIRWDGRDNTHLVRPNGQVEFQTAALAGIVRPKGADDRVICMTALMNKLAAEGYEFDGLASGEQIVMRRAR